MSKKKQQKKSNEQKFNLNLRKIKLLTDTQIKAYSSWCDNKNLVLHGVAGTGKTFLAMYFALNDSRKIRIIRSVVQSREVGFLPGSLNEKIEIFKEPYKGIMSNLYGRDDAYEIFEKKGLIEFSTTSFLRGLTWDNCIVIIDEFQNMNDMELHTIMTRIGENTSFIMCGDVKQNDLRDEPTGAYGIMSILEKLDCVDIIEFGYEDVLRSGFVKEYLKVREENGFY